MRSIAKLVILATLVSAVSLCGQVPHDCRAPVPAPPPDSRNIFTQAQEADLGDAIYESRLLGLRIVSEGDARLQSIAARLLRDTPLASTPIPVFIVAIPD